MASIYDFKGKFQALLRPICQQLARAGVTANQVTIAAFLLSAFWGAMIAATQGAAILLGLLPIILFIRMGMNAIDGMLAREHGQKSHLGAMLNELTDVLGDAVLYLPFAFAAGVNAPLLVTVVVLGVISEGAGLAALQIGASRRYDGPFGKSDRAFFFGALGLLFAFSVAPGMWSDIALGAAAILGAVTIVNRTRAALREVENGKL